MTEQRTYDNTNTGALFSNKDRQKDTHPNARGRINVDGKWYWLASWTKTNSNSGEKFMSLAVTALTDEEVNKYIEKKAAPQKPAQGQEDGDHALL